MSDDQTSNERDRASGDDTSDREGDARDVRSFQFVAPIEGEEGAIAEETATRESDDEPTDDEVGRLPTLDPVDTDAEARPVLEQGWRFGTSDLDHSARYEIVERISETDGSGLVYEARDLVLDRLVAVKISRIVGAFERMTEAELRESLRLFEREARTTAKLQHPNVITIHDFGHLETESYPVPYLVLEYLHGRTLGEQLDATDTCSEKRAVDIAIDVAKALRACHEAGLIHRDLKPDNIFLCRDGRIVLIDFGVSAFDRTRQTVQESLNRWRDSLSAPLPSVAGTPGYMAPEQSKGTPQDVRADLWGLGTVLFEMLTGRRLMEPSSLELDADLVSPSLDEEAPDMSGPLKRIVSILLEPDPSERYEDVDALLRDLEDVPDQLD